MSSPCALETVSESIAADGRTETRRTTTFLDEVSERRGAPADALCAASSHREASAATATTPSARRRDRRRIAAGGRLCKATRQGHRHGAATSCAERRRSRLHDREPPPHANRSAGPWRMQEKQIQYRSGEGRGSARRRTENELESAQQAGRYGPGRRRPLIVGVCTHLVQVKRLEASESEGASQLSVGPILAARGAVVGLAGRTVEAVSW